MSANRTCSITPISSSVSNIYPNPGSSGSRRRVRTDDVVFFWWQGKDASVVTQVVDFARGAVYATWTSADRKLSGFQGQLRRLE
jgi:hypothetical protein